MVATFYCIFNLSDAACFQKATVSSLVSCRSFLLPVVNHISTSMLTGRLLYFPITWASFHQSFSLTPKYGKYICFPTILFWFFSSQFFGTLFSMTFFYLKYLWKFGLLICQIWFNFYFLNILLTVLPFLMCHLGIIRFEIVSFSPFLEYYYNYFELNLSKQYFQSSSDSVSWNRNCFSNIIIPQN